MPNFSEWLTATRKSRGLSQRSLAKKSGVSSAMVSRLEGNKVGASTDLVNSLADALEIPRADAMNVWLASRTNEPKAKVTIPSDFIPPADMRPVTLSTGEIIYLSPDDPDPENTTNAVEAFLTGYRAGKKNRN